MDLPAIHFTNQDLTEALLRTITANEPVQEDYGLPLTIGFPARFPWSSKTREIILLLIAQLHKAYWGSTLGCEQFSLTIAVSGFVQDPASLAASDGGRLFPDLAELQRIAKSTCRCEVNFTAVETHTNHTAQRPYSPRCNYVAEIFRSQSTPNATDTSSSRSSHQLQGYYSDASFEAGTSWLHLTISRVMRNRRLVSIKAGNLALVPNNIQPGDAIFLLVVNVPFVLRQAEDKGQDYQQWDVVGESYVHGVMEGQIWEDVKQSLGPVHLV